MCEVDHIAAFLRSEVERTAAEFTDARVKRLKGGVDRLTAALCYPGTDAQR